VQVNENIATHFFDDGEEVTVYMVIGAPPSVTGAVHVTIDELSLAEEPETPVGAPGTVDGTAPAEEPTEVPLPFVAVTVNTYLVPFVRPRTVQVKSPVVVQVFAPGDDVTVYPVIEAPPFETGAAQETTDLPSAYEVALTRVGEPATIDGRASAEALEAILVPRAFVAVTVNVYSVPFVKPTTAQVIAELLVQVFAPGEEVTKYEVTTAPPVLGSNQETTAWPFSNEVAVTPAGADGTVEGTTALDEMEATERPLAFVAVTENVYGVPLVKPTTVQVSAVVVVQVFASGEDVTVYPVIAAPPFETGAVQETTDCAFSFEVAFTRVGAPGTVVGIAAAEAADATDVPLGFVAVTMNV